MKDCTILFKECEKGHSRLVAANWVDKGCHWCQLEAARGVVEQCAKIADAYADNPLGDEQQDTQEAFDHGMRYTTGGCDTASAIAEAIRKLDASLPTPAAKG